MLWLVSSLPKPVKGNRLISAPGLVWWIIFFFPLKYLCCFCSEGRYRISYKQAGGVWKLKLRKKAEEKAPLEQRKNPYGPNIPGLCGWQSFVPDKPFLHTHPGTSPAGSPWRSCPAGSWGSRTSSRSPWTRTPGRWEPPQSTHHKAGLAWGETASCGVGREGGKEAEIGSVSAILTASVLYTAIYVTVLLPAHCKGQLCRCADQRLNIVPF